MDYFKELTAIVGASNYAATGDERWLKVAASAAPKAESTAAAERDSRFNKQASIEAQIMAFKPDFLEAAEIVDAIRATIERREMPDEIREELATSGKAFRDALGRAGEVVPQ